MISTNTTTFDSPAKKKIPRSERIQKRRSIPAISLSGLGRIPTIARIIANIMRFQRVIVWLLIENTGSCGIV